RGNLAVAQAAGQIDAIHVGHLVVDHKAVDAGRADRVQQRSAATERLNGEAVRFKKESQRAEDVKVVVDHIDHRWCYEWRHRESPRIIRADPDYNLPRLARGGRPGLDLAQSLSRPARIAS